jgi:hypothetical protein
LLLQGFVVTAIGATNLLMIYKLRALAFLYGMSTAAYIQSGRYKKVLLIGADKMSLLIIQIVLLVLFLVTVQVLFYLSPIMKV